MTRLPCCLKDAAHWQKLHSGAASEKPTASKSLMDGTLHFCRTPGRDLLCVLAAGRAKGRKKATGAQSVLRWDWDGQRDKVARSLAGVIDIDLWKLYWPKPIEEALLQTCFKTVRSHAVMLRPHQVYTLVPLKCQHQHFLRWHALLDGSLG